MMFMSWHFRGFALLMMQDATNVAGKLFLLILQMKYLKEKKEKKNFVAVENLAIFALVIFSNSQITGWQPLQL